MHLYWMKELRLLKHWDFVTGKFTSVSARNLVKTSMNLIFCRQNKRKRFILSDKLHPQTISCVQTRAEPFEIKIEVENVFETDFSKKDISGVIFQYPDTEGSIHDFTKVIRAAQANGTMTVAATDLMALTILKPPGNTFFSFLPKISKFIYFRNEAIKQLFQFKKNF